MRRFSLLALSFLAACEPPTPEVNVNIVLEPPMEIDTFQDECIDGDVVNDEPYYSEEMCANVTVPLDDWYIEARQVDLDFNDYCVQYSILNENGTIDQYCNGMQLHLDGGESAQIPLRAVAFEQKQQAQDQFGGAIELVVKATLTMYATNRWNGEELEIVADYDTIWTNFNNCAGAAPVCTYILPFDDASAN